jgi:CRISPR type IV-associated protein Csf3
MIPLTITARMAGAVCLPEYGLALDACLAFAECQKLGLAPAFNAAEVVPIEIPVATEPEGRFHLCSNSVAVIDQRETRYVQRRPVVAEAQLMGRRIRRMQINAGPSKGFRIPMEVVYLEHDELRWWCVGDLEGVRGLLDLVHHIGKRRGVGVGRVLEWSVVSCEPWGEGFPVVLEGNPLRTLPPDWPGLVDPMIVPATLTYPYWLMERRQDCAVPVVL